MPSVAVAPAPYRFTFGDVTTQPARETIGALAILFTGGSVSAGPESALSGEVAVPKLDRISRQEPITNPSRTAAQRFQLIWQRTMEAIEDAFRAQQAQIADLTTIVARLEAAEEKAAAAQEVANETAAADALAQSYREPSNILSASSDGSISIAGHTLHYGDGTSVSLDAGALSGWTPGDYVQVYYDDAGREGGAVSYQGTTGQIAQQGARHIVGGVTIPQAGEPPSGGVTQPPPGYVPPPGGNISP